jgi:hypothetical protein
MNNLLVEHNLELTEIFQLIRRHAVTVLLVWIVVFTGTFLVVQQLPKKFKSTAILNIPSSYFSNPLVRELVPEPSEPGELNAQRISLLKFAMNEEFLDSLGENFKIYQYPRDTRRRIEERDQLREKIEYFTLSPTTVQLSSVQDNANQAFHLMQAVMSRMIAVLVEERYRSLEKARNAIQEQTKFLAKALTRAKKVSNAKHLEDELRKVNTDLAAIRQKYTDKHPEVAELINQAVAMKAQIVKEKGNEAPLPQSNDTDAIAAAISNDGSSSSLENLYNDLLRKLSYLSIALSMERGSESMSFLSILQQPSLPTKPFFPNIKVASVFAALLASFISVGIILASETKRRTLISPQTAAIALDTQFIGELPLMKNTEKTLLIGYDEIRALPPAQKTNNDE